MKSPSARTCYTFVIGLLLSFTADIHAEEPPDRKAVQALIEQLSAAESKTRKDAEEQLWKMGPVIEPQLVEALPSAGFEATQRIRTIRRYFKFGITPDIPPQQREQVILALEGKEDSAEAARILTAAGRFRPVVAILQRLPRDRTFNQYLSTIRIESRQLPPSEELDQFYVDLLRLALKHPDESQSRIMVRSIAGDAQIRSRLSSVGGFEKLLELISECKGDVERRRLIDALSLSSAMVTPEFVDRGLLVKWINLLAADPDQRIRERQISKLFSASTVLSTSAGHQLNLGTLYDQLSPAGQHVLIDLMSQMPLLLQRLHERIGDERILQGCGQTADAAAGSNLVGRVASLSSWPKQEDAEHGILDLLEREDDAAARQQMVLGFLQGLSRKTPSTFKAVPRETTDALWQLLSGDDPQPWQLLAPLETYRSEQVFGTYHDAETLKRMFGLASIADKAAAHTFAYAPANNRYLCEQLGRHGLAMEFLETIVALPADFAMETRLGLLLGSSRFTDSFKTAEERKSLLDLVRQRFSGRAKSLIAAGITRNTSLLGKLTEELDHAAVKAALLENLPENAQADILGRLMTSAQPLPRWQNRINLTCF